MNSDYIINEIDTDWIAECVIDLVTEGCDVDPNNDGNLNMYDAFICAQAYS